MGDNGEGGRSAGGSPAGAGPHPVSADQSSPVRDIITTKWGAASSQITLYKHLYPDPAFRANVTCKILYIQYWHPASGHSSGWNVTANFPDCIGSRSSVAVLSWSRDTSVNYQAPSFQSGSGNLNPSSSFRKRDEEWLGGEIGGNYLLLISQTDGHHNTWLMPHLGLFQHRGFVELESDTLGLTGGMRQ